MTCNGIGRSADTQKHSPSCKAKTPAKVRWLCKIFVVADCITVASNAMESLLGTTAVGMLGAAVGPRSDTLKCKEVSSDLYFSTRAKAAPARIHNTFANVAQHPQKVMHIQDSQRQCCLPASCLQHLERHTCHM